jgi:phosphohistidine phosphatase
MKKLIFVRHGRAEDPSPEFTDYERSLTPKGKNISKQVARILAGTEGVPGLFITSPAFRALETAMIFAGIFGVKPETIILDNNLYYKMNYHYLLSLLSEVEKDIESVILFGHNPSFSEISNSLSSNGCDFMPKSGVAGISFNVKTWPEVKYGTGKLEYFLKPEKIL